MEVVIDIKGSEWAKMTEQQRKEYLIEREVAAQPKPMTDRDRLAEKLFFERMKHHEGIGSAVNFKNWSEQSVDAANIFFDTLEANTESKGEKWGDQS